MPWVPPVLVRRVVAANRFFVTAEEDLADPAGNPYTYHQIESRWDAVLILPLLADGTLVLERIYRHPYGRYLLEFPAGGIEAGEDPLRAAARELEEETGYRAGNLRKLGSVEAIPGMLRARVQVVLARDLVQTGTRSHETMELIQVEEMPFENAWAQAQAEPTSSFLTLGLLWLAKEGLAGA